MSCRRLRSAALLGQHQVTWAELDDSRNAGKRSAAQGKDSRKLDSCCAKVGTKTAPNVMTLFPLPDGLGDIVTVADGCLLFAFSARVRVKTHGLVRYHW